MGQILKGLKHGRRTLFRRGVFTIAALAARTLGIGAGISILWVKIVGPIALCAIRIDSITARRCE